MDIGQNVGESIKHRLNALILILFQDLSLRDDSFTLKKKIALLSKSGLGPKEISEILRRSEGYVNKELTLIRRRDK